MSSAKAGKASRASRKAKNVRRMGAPFEEAQTGRSPSLGTTPSASLMAARYDFSLSKGAALGKSFFLPGRISPLDGSTISSSPLRLSNGISRFQREYTRRAEAEKST